VGTKAAATRPVAAGAREPWAEESVGAVRIKCREAAGRDFRDPALSPAGGGGIPAAVSRPGPSRAGGGVSTSGKRVCRCSGPAVFRLIVRALGGGADVGGTVAGYVGRGLSARETALVRRAVGQAIDLIRCEEREIRRYGHRCHERVLAATP